jgi:hypothetical protein
MKRPDIPVILPAKQARPALSQRLAEGLRHADRPWSIGLDFTVLAGFLALLCWETGQFAVTGDGANLAAAVLVLTSGVIYAFRAFTSPARSENDR